MDNNAEVGKPLPSSESSASPTLELQYANLKRTFLTCDKLIPQKGLQIYSDGDGKRVDRKKEFKPREALSNTQEALRKYFPEHSQQSQIIESANIFLRDIVSNMDPEAYDTQSRGQLDIFLTEFPENIINKLGNQASAETIVRIIKIGSDIVRNCIKPQYYTDYVACSALRLVRKDIPQAVVRQGLSGQVVLDKLESATDKINIFDFSSLVEYLKESRGDAENQNRVAHLEGVIKQIGSKKNTDNNPFAQLNREPWKTALFIGKEKRMPEWMDLAMMARATEQDGIEYGISIGSNDPNHSDSPNITYLRGVKGSVYNGGSGIESFRENVFFHTHPGHNSPETSPLVSLGDVESTLFNDKGGGGYLNNVSAKGITFHIGSASKDVGENNSYSIESGKMKGEKIPRGFPVEVSNMMRQLNETGPYIYSVCQGGIKYYFVQIPWEQIDMSISFYSLCFENGLEQLLAGIKDLPEIPKALNLYQAMKDSSSLRDRLDAEAIK